MNRWLSIPAGLCIVAFTVLYAALVGAVGGESLDQSPPTPESLDVSFNPSTKPNLTRKLAVADAEQTLVSLRDEFLRPWRTLETSPHRMYSRAMPKPIPSISAEIQLVKALGETDGCIVGTISVQHGTIKQTIACVVDRQTNKARFFQGGKWLSQDEWLQTAPVPQ